tara:strand:+ start:646 stop:1632 length:987 start_codon:yes stop_codon:yes gene_type:complete
MPDFNSPKNTLPDLMPLEEDRSVQLSSEELGAIRASLMETGWRTKAIVDVLERKNILLERDLDKITNLKRRLRRSIGIIPNMPGVAGSLFGVGVGMGFIPPLGGEGNKWFQPFIRPPRVNRTPTPQEDSIRVTDDVRVDVKEDVKEDIRVRVPEPELEKGVIREPELEKGVIKDPEKGVIREPETNEQRSGTSIWDLPLDEGLYPGLKGILDKDGIGKDIYNPNNLPETAFSWKAFMDLEKGKSNINQPVEEGSPPISLPPVLPILKFIFMDIPGFFWSLRGLGQRAGVDGVPNNIDVNTSSDDLASLQLNTRKSDTFIIITDKDSIT